MYQITESTERIKKVNLRRFFCIFLLMICSVGCQTEQSTVVDFKVKYQGRLLACQPNTDLMFFVSDFKTTQKLPIDHSKFANEAVALIGAECSELGWQVTLKGDIKEGEAVSFDLGVPFAHNHTNPLTAKSPLNASEMFWSWQLGHKFLRFDEADFSFHLGSTGCTSASRLRAPNHACESPNRYRFTVPAYQSDKPIIFDLDRLFNGVDKSQSCMSEPENATCQLLFANLQQSLFYQE